MGYAILGVISTVGFLGAAIVVGIAFIQEGEVGIALLLSALFVFLAALLIKISTDEWRKKQKSLKEQERKEKVFQELLSKKGLEKIEELTPFQFEEWVAKMLKTKGYRTTTTKRSGDFGIDVIAYANNSKIGIQVKKFKKSVGIRAVQEAIAGSKYYRCTESWVITSAYSYTPAARELARVNGVKLLTRDDIARLLESDIIK